MTDDAERAHTRRCYEAPMPSSECDFWCHEPKDSGAPMELSNGERRVVVWSKDEGLIARYAGLGYQPSER